MQELYVTCATLGTVMVIGLGQRMTQTQRMQNVQLMSFQLRKNFQLLSVPINELRSLIFKESEENPLFEINSEPNQDSLDTISARASEGYDSNKKHEALQQVLSRPETLSEHLIFQLHLGSFDERETELGILLLSDLDANGFFIEDPILIVQSSPQFSSYTQATLEKILHTLMPRLQELEPMGCATRNVVDSLHVQSRFIEMEKSERKTLNECITQFGDLILKKSNIEEAEEQFKHILHERGMTEYFSLLNPYPGLGYNTSYNNISEYIYPDAEVIVDSTQPEGLSVKINTDLIPIVELGTSLLPKDAPHSSEGVRMEREWRSQVEMFIEGLQYRSKLLEKILLFVVSRQKQFILGATQFPLPLTQKEVAKILELSEATVSRAKNAKYIQLPNRIIPLSLLFSRGVGSNQVAKEMVMEKIKLLLAEAESEGMSMSDREIAEYLKHEGIAIARRTVSKYRKQTVI